MFLSHRWRVDVVHVYRPYERAVKGVLDRAAKEASKDKVSVFVAWLISDQAGQIRWAGTGPLHEHHQQRCARCVLAPVSAVHRAGQFVSKNVAGVF